MIIELIDTIKTMAAVQNTPDFIDEMSTLQLGNLSNPSLGLGFWVSVIKVEEESSMKNFPNVRFDKNDDTYKKKNPKIYLNYYLMFSYTVDNYKDGIKLMHKLVGFFQKNRSVEVTNNGNTLGHVNFDLFSPSFEQINQIWSVNGGKFLPNVIYKARVCEYQSTFDGLPVAPIKSIEKVYEHKR